MNAEKEFNDALFSDSDNEFYARLKIDLNTCYTITWSSTTEKVLLTNANGEPIDLAGNAYTTVGGSTPIPSSSYTYSTIFVPSNGTDEFKFSEVYRSALREQFLKVWE